MTSHSYTRNKNVNFKLESACIQLGQVSDFTMNQCIWILCKWPSLMHSFIRVSFSFQLWSHQSENWTHRRFWYVLVLLESIMKIKGAFSSFRRLYSDSLLILLFWWEKDKFIPMVILFVNAILYETQNDNLLDKW